MPSPSPHQIPANCNYYPHVHHNLSETIGETPLVHLTNLSRNLYADILVKLEFFNPMATVKDRPTKYLLDALEREGKLKPGMRVIEASRGSTGYSLASLCAQRGYKLTLTAPNCMTEQQLAWFVVLGADIVLTPAEYGTLGSVMKACELVAADNDAVLLGQFYNDNNAHAHYTTTGPEIWHDCGGRIDYFVAGIGTGGTFSGTGKYLKDQNPNIKLIGVEPDGGALHSGQSPSSHHIIGIGPGFITPIMERDLADDFAVVTQDEAFQTIRTIMASDGIPIGLASGAVLSAALKIAQNPKNIGKTITAMVTSCTERYMNTAFAAPDILAAKNLCETPIDADAFEAFKSTYLHQT